MAKEDGTADKNLVSISEEQDSTEPTRIGSLRQGKDKSSKITNFSLTKKPREKDSRAKNGMVEKEKKSGQIKDSKSRIDEETNGSVKKKNDSIISDGNSSFTEAGLNDTADLELESAVASMRVLDPDLNSSVQVSSV